MDMDLSRALHEAAQAGTAHRPSIATGPVLQRIRRRRNARIAVESTVGVAAAGAVAVGAVQITGLRGVEPVPVPPATSSPTPTSTPTPTPSAAPVFPDAVTAAGPLVCDVLPAISDPAGDAELRFEPTLLVGGAAVTAPADGSGVPLTPGEPLGVDPVLSNGSDVSLDAVGLGAPQVWFVAADGTVAGHLRTTERGPATTPYTGGAGARFSGEQLSGVPTDCSPTDGGTGESAQPLPPGSYDLYVVQEVRLSAGPGALVTGPPVPVVVAEPVVEEPEAPASPQPGLHPDLEDLVLSPAGLGPLAVGVPPGSNPGAAMIERDPDYCDPEVFPDTDTARWVPSGYPLEERDGEPRQAFHVDADEDGVYRIDVLGPTIRTAEGVRVGSTLAELQAAYPRLEGPSGDVGSRVWWLTGPTGTLVFETMAQGPDGMPSADAPERVILMRVLVAGEDPRFTAANSDNIAGTCV